MHPIVDIAAYQFLPLSELKQRRAHLLRACKHWHLKGAIALGPEGVQLRVPGSAPQIDLLLAELSSWPGLNLRPRMSGVEQQRFQRMTVRIKQELVALGVVGIEPAGQTSAVVQSPELAF